MNGQTLLRYTAAFVAAFLVLTTAITPGQTQDKSDSDYFKDFKTRLGGIEKHVSVVNRLKYASTSLTLKALMSELGRRPDAKTAFTWVRDNIAFEPYEGHLRDTRAVLMSRSGNSLDQALLLREMLATLRIKTRIAYGNLKATDRERLMLAYLGKASFKGTGVPGNTPKYNPESDRRLVGDVTRHYWVEANIKGKWVAMSPAFPRGVYGVSPTTKTGEHDGVPDGAKVTL
ncbi:MAG: transglutaminase domain-containing protein, partial [Myxococcota bacterium]